MTIFLTRHSQDYDNKNNILNGHRNTKLTELGKQQAYEKAHILKIEKDLIERNFGILTGKPICDIIKYSSKIIKTKDVDYFIEADGAENFLLLYERAEVILKKIILNCSNKNILIVTHGDIGKMILAVYYGLKWEKGLKSFSFKNTDIFKLVD